MADMTKVQEQTKPTPPGPPGHSSKFHKAVKLGHPSWEGEWGWVGGEEGTTGAQPASQVRSTGQRREH